MIVKDGGLKIKLTYDIELKKNILQDYNPGPRTFIAKNHSSNENDLNA